MVVKQRTARPLIITAGLLGATGVLLGAFGAHGLENFLHNSGEVDTLWVAKRLTQFDVGVRYHLLHAIALLAFSGLSERVSSTISRIVVTCWVAGVCLFSGMLYALVITNTPVLGAIVPVGGLLMIVGWLALCFGKLRIES